MTITTTSLNKTASQPASQPASPTQPGWRINKYAIDARAWTPLGETLFKLYTYFMSRNSADRPVGVDGASVFPRYRYRDSDGAPESWGGNVPGDPVQEACQKNFIIMITDGEPTRDDFTHVNNSWTDGFDDSQILDSWI